MPYAKRKCPECGGPMSYRGPNSKYPSTKTCRKCWKSPRGPEHQSWKTSGNHKLGHLHARILYPVMGQCEKCNVKPAVERHHEDGNTMNNVRSNVKFVCRACHMIEDGRLKRFVDNRPDLRRLPKPCISCGKLAKPLRQGRCRKCADELYRTKNRAKEEGERKWETPHA